MSSKPQRGSVGAGVAAAGGGPATADPARLERAGTTVGEFWDTYRNLILGERIAELTARNYDSACGSEWARPSRSVSCKT